MKVKVGERKSYTSPTGREFMVEKVKCRFSSGTLFIVDECFKDDPYNLFRCGTWYGFEYHEMMKWLKKQ